MALIAMSLLACTGFPPGRPADTSADPRLSDPRGGLTAPACDAAAPVFLNEVSPANRTVLFDVDGESVDWLELFNVGSQAVDLAGWTLSDDPDEPQKWTFPQVTIRPGMALLVHASGKDKDRVVGHWETRIDQGHDWRYLAVSSEPDAHWHLPEYDDSAWALGPSGFGRGDSDDATRLTTDTIYIRTQFELTAAEQDDLVALALHMDYDDGFAAYLNGVEIARVALGLAGSGPAPWDSFAAYSNEGLLSQGLRPAYFELDHALWLLREGSNTLAIEVHNQPESSDVSLVPFLSLGFASEGESSSPALLALPEIDLHTNFSLRASGEAVRLFDPAGCQADVLDPGPLWADESYGRSPDGTGPLGYFLQPTPGWANKTEWREGFAPTPTFDPPAGRYPGGAQVTLSAEGAAVHYALGGKEPTEADPLVGGAVETGDDDEVVVLRARAFQEGLWPSRIATASYLIAATTDLPVVSLVTDPDNLWDDETGIYTLGTNAAPEYPWSGANFYQDWKRPVHVEHWEPDGTLGFSVNGAVAIQGGNSRRHDQKNLEVSVGGGWGDEEAITYRIFPELELDRFSRLVLRAGGGDWLGCWYEGCIGGILSRDRLMHAITQGVDIDRMASRPVVAYLNGEYWGIYFLNEKSDGTYVVDHHGQEDIDLLRNNAIPRQGDEANYLALLEWLRAHDLSNPANYFQARSLIDIEEFQNYQIFEIFYDNRDWPGNNIEFWRPRAEGGRWRWLLFGTDLGLGADERDPDIDTLGVALAADGDGWPNPPWSTEMLRLLLQSPEFTDTFLNRYADLLNTLLLPERTRALHHTFADEIAAEVPRHAARWGNWTDGADSYSLQGGEWEQGVAYVDWWLGERPTHAREHLVEHFGLQGTWALTLDADPPGSATFELTAVTVDPPFTGTYFQGVPVTVTVHPAPGFTFQGWSDPTLPSDRTVTLEPSGALSLTAQLQ